MWRRQVVVVCAAVALVGSMWTGDIGVIELQSVSAQSATCLGDFNGDGKVNLADFLAFAGGFGARSGDANFNARLDLDGNGAIDLSDFLAFAGVFGTNCEDRPRGSVSGDRAALVAFYNATDGPNWAGQHELAHRHAPWGNGTGRVHRCVRTRCAPDPSWQMGL